MDEVFNQLNALVDKFKKNKKLSVTDNKAVKEELGRLLVNREFANTACRLMANLPPEPCCQAVLDAWRASDEAHAANVIELFLNEPSMTGTAGCLRKIVLIGSFLPEDTGMSLRILIDVSARLTMDGTKSPGRPLLQRFWKELMATKKLLNIPLGKHILNARELSGVAGMVLLGLLESRGADSREDIVLKQDFLNWLNVCGSKIELGKNIIAEAEKATKNWPEDLQRKCIELGLIETVVTNVKPDRTNKTGPKESVPPVNLYPAHEEREIAGTPLIQVSKGLRPITEAREPGDTPSTGLNVRMCLDWLARYTTALEKQNEILKQRMDALDFKHTQEKIRHGELERQKEQLLTDLRRHEQLICDLREQMTGIQREKQNLQNSLREERLTRERETDRLKNQIDRECNYVLGEFRNMLFDKLSRYYREYLGAKERPASVELAGHLKFVIDRIFRELNNQGIRFDGDN